MATLSVLPSLLTLVAIIITEGGKLSQPRPVIYMHGILNQRHEADFAMQYISKIVVGCIVYPVDVFNGLESVIGLNRQLQVILPLLQEIMDAHMDTGVTLLCYSQGGVICRAALHLLSRHNVVTAIFLSSPLAGQYGLTRFIAPFVGARERQYVWKALYTTEGQDLSVGNYWNDPHHQTEFSDPKLSILLAVLNNQTGHSNSTEYKANFLKLSRLVLIGGPDDAVITPWQSAHFGYYDEHDEVLPMEKQLWYIHDDFGLRTLNEDGRTHIHIISGIDHIFWYRNASVFDCCVIPYI